jgi:hypothetical protein
MSIWQGKWKENSVRMHQQSNIIYEAAVLVILIGRIHKLRRFDLGLHDIVTCRGDYRRGFRLAIGFTDHLYTWLGPTSNYSATANLHNSQITTAPAKHFPFFCVFTSRSWQRLLTVEILHLHALKSSLHRLPYRTDLVAPVVLLITARHGPRRNIPFAAVPLFLRVDSLLLEHVYRGVA